MLIKIRVFLDRRHGNTNNIIEIIHYRQHVGQFYVMVQDLLFEFIFIFIRPVPKGLDQVFMCGLEMGIIHSNRVSEESDIFGVMR
jgi:hypothetical protein